MGQRGMGHWGSTFSGDLKVPGYGTGRDDTSRTGTGAASLVVVDLQVHEGVNARMLIGTMANVRPRCPISDIHCQIGARNPPNNNSMT